MSHISVLFQPIIEWLAPRADGKYIDGTLGFGGHTLGLLEGSAPDGQVLAFDRDAQAIALVQARLGDLAKRVTFVHQSFVEIGRIAPQYDFAQVDGIVFDLGLSSMQLDTAERGFSFRHDAPLDMRFDTTQGQTAADLINNLSETALSDIFWRYGEEKRSRRLARVIVDNRPIITTKQLADLIAAHTSAKQRRTKRIHPATQIFQALRIAVNNELSAIETGLPAAIALLKPAGRIAVITFHSLEDRIVKNLFRDLSRDCICPPQQPVCTCNHKAQLRLPRRKPIVPDSAEITANPRSRSAKLRIAEKI